MRNRRTVLLASPCTPDPLGTGWEQRAYSFLLAYCRFMDVHLWFIPTADNPDLTRARPLTTLCRSITTFLPPLVRHEQSGLKARLAAHLSSSDLVHVFRFEGFVWNIEHDCIVWDIDELPWSLRQPRPGETPRPMPDDRLERDRASFARCVGKCRLVIGCSRLERPTDCAAFAVVPNVARRPTSAGRETAVADRSLLFVGNLNYSPNIDGLTFFKDQVLPILEGLVPDVEVVVVGRSPATDGARAAADRLRQDGRLRLAFDVPDCAPFYAGSAASIAPIRAGGGTRIKIIESFANRCPVVSTSKGCEGLDVEHGRHLLIADSPRDFAQACAQLLRDPSLRARIADAACGYYELGHTQEVVDRLVMSTIGSLLPH